MSISDLITEGIRLARAWERSRALLAPLRQVNAALTDLEEVAPEVAPEVAALRDQLLEALRGVEAIDRVLKAKMDIAVEAER